MPHKIEPGPLPNIVVLTLYGDMTSEDFVTADDLGISIMPRYLLIDASKLTLGLPDHFLSNIRSTPVIHPNCLHTAVIIRSELLKNVAAVALKLVQARDKVTIVSSYTEALNHLVALAQESAGK
jgi:hypothetical protein